MKRVISMALVLMLVLSLATTAFATTITVNVDNETSHPYRAYQIFSGSHSEDAANLGQIEWSDAVDGAAILAELKATYGDLYSDQVTTAAGVATILSGNSTAYPNSQRGYDFANIVVKHLDDPNNTDNYTDIAADATNVTLETGYYLIVDVSTSADLEANKPDARNIALLQVTSIGDLTIRKKFDVPVIDKDIMIAKGDTVEASNVGEYNIGDVVDFTLEAKLPMNLTDYDVYKMVFHDKMDTSLDLLPANETADTELGNFKVYYAATENGARTEITTGWSVNYDPAADACDAGYGDACSFELTLNDATTITNVVNHGYIFVTYQAVINETVKINQVNKNEYTLEFSNDPNWNPTDESPVSPTGITPPSEVEYYSTDIVLQKIDAYNDQPLTGAQFTLTGDTNQVMVKTEDVFVAYTDTAYEEGNKYWLLTDGTYTETDPDTEGIDTSAYANDGKVYKLVKGVETLMGKGTASTTIASYVGADGKVTFSGLGVGTYTIEETVVPKGYNKIADIVLEVTFDNDTKKFSYSWSGGMQGSSEDQNAVIVIENARGQVLPETGGMGTTLFYLIGGLMVAASAVLLITKKRMIAE